MSLFEEECGMSFTLALSGNTSILSANFNPPIYLEDNVEYVIGLTNFETFNAIPNIDEKNNKFYFGKSNRYVEIPTGSYEITDINNYLVSHLLAKGVSISIKPNNNTLKTAIKCSEKVIFNENSIGKLLGFKNQVIPPNKSVHSDSPAEIIKVNALSVDCNIATGSYFNGKPVHIIHQFFPTVAPGYKIVETPQNILYFPVSVSTITNITLKIFDQDGDLVNFRGETITIRLHIKKIIS